MKEYCFSVVFTDGKSVPVYAINYFIAAIMATSKRIEEGLGYKMSHIRNLDMHYVIEKPELTMTFPEQF